MSNYVGAEQALVEDWIEGRMAAVGPFLETISLGLGSRVFNNVSPPENSTYPFVVYQCQSPPRDVRGVGAASVMVDTLYVVKAVAQTSSYSDLAPIAKIIHLALTVPEGEQVHDGAVFSSIREEQFSLPEISGGKQFRHLGGVYKIQAQG